MCSASYVNNLDVLTYPVLTVTRVVLLLTYPVLTVTRIVLLLTYHVITVTRVVLLLTNSVLRSICWQINFIHIRLQKIVYLDNCLINSIFIPTILIRSPCVKAWHFDLMIFTVFIQVL
jgi:hypothetical protein